MIDFLPWLFDTTPFVPRAHCGNWTSTHILVDQLANAAIALAYFGVPIVLVVVWYKRRDVLPAAWALLSFATFIFFCGLGHFEGAIVFWVAPYRFITFTNICTAVASISTLIGLCTSLKHIFKIPLPGDYERVVRERDAQIDYIERRNIETERRLNEAEDEIFKLRRMIAQTHDTQLSDQADRLREMIAHVRAAATPTHLRVGHYGDQPNQPRQ